VKFGSVCSGIEAASVAWEPLGWKAAWLSEIEPFPSAVLKHHYPDVPNLGDMTQLPSRILNGEVEAPDLFCGGTPCQAFSVAGLRKSLDDARGNLSLTFCEIANAIDHVRRAAGQQPCIVFWENVPGVLNTKDNAFGCFLAGVAGEELPLLPPGGKWTNAGCVLGPERAVAWRVLDAQHFGVAQRRRRVFVVASARDGFDPAAVLFEFDGLRRDTAPIREAGQKPAPTIAGCANGGGANGPGRDVDSVESLVPVTYSTPAIGTIVEDAVASCITKNSGAGGETQNPAFVMQPVTYDFFNITAPVNRQSREPGDPCHTLARSNAEHAVVMQPVAFHPTQDPISSTDICHSISSGNGQGCATAAVAFHENQRAEVTLNDTAGTVKCAGGKPGQGYPAVLTAMQVRRLTPVECERLQGFPDGYTAIPWRGKPVDNCPDGPRYKALGNSWAVPCVRWIGQRIARQVEVSSR